MINGNSLVLEVGKETEYGAKASPEKRIEVSTEAFKEVRNKTGEGLLTGGITDGRVELMSIHNEGSFSTIAKPESIGYLLKGVFGKESVEEETEDVEGVETPTGFHIHKFAPIGNEETDVLPSCTFIVDRKARVFAYTGCKFNSMSFSAEAEDRLKVDFELRGKAEETGAVDKTLVAEHNPSFKFYQADVKLNGSRVANITSIKFSYSNNLDADTYTTDTGIYPQEPTHGMREITCEFSAQYSSALEAIRENYWKTDDTFSIDIEFTDGKGNSLKVSFPCVQLSAMDNATMTGAETISQSFSAKAVENGVDEVVEVILKNEVEEEY